jgi:signal transduction histidine kinase/ActR/RegA family two-component response regulator
MRLAATLARVPDLLPRARRVTAPEGGEPRWRDLSLWPRAYVAVVIASGAAATVAWFPRSMPDPVLFGVLATFSGLTSAWKVTLPIPIRNGSTLSVSYAANLMALLLLGLEPALLVALVGVGLQCGYRARWPYPTYRTVFSLAAAALTMVATGVVFAWLGGPAAPLDSLALAKPLVGAIAAYFVVNTGLVAGAIALSTGRSCLSIWRQDFLWSGASFMVAGTAGALAAAAVQSGEHWKAVLLVAPIYLIYRTYQLFAGRLEDQQRHTDEIQRLHEGAVAALGQARAAERALAEEKERLAVALGEMTRLEAARHQLLEREQAARAAADEANRLKDQFLAIVSHELRTPLTAILGWSDILGKRAIDSAIRDRAVQGIAQSARRQAQLIEDLLDVARITSGKLRLERTLLDLRDIVRDAVELVQPSADAKEVTIVLDAETPVGEVYGDAVRLQQVASNLLSNAVKFTPEGGTVYVTVRRAGALLELRVRDTGKGIAPEFLPWVFEPFRQADEATTRAHAGLGLGLSIVKTLVSAHHGSVSAESAGEGQGAVFSVRLPAVTEPTKRAARTPQTATARSSAPRAHDAALDGVTVLVVDDDEQTREVVSAHLLSARAQVLTTSSVPDALNLVRRTRVHVLIADIGMPGQDGYDLIRRLREISDPGVASIPAAALTAFARAEDRGRALAAGFQMHLPKPIDGHALVAAVATLAGMQAA